MQHKYLNDGLGNLRFDVIQCIRENGIIVLIPNDPQNRDWQIYQKWLAEGNVPMSATN